MNFVGRVSIQLLGSTSALHIEIPRRRFLLGLFGEGRETLPGWRDRVGLQHKMDLHASQMALCPVGTIMAQDDGCQFYYF